MTALIEQAVVFDCAGEQCLGIVHEAQSSRSTVGVLVIVMAIAVDDGVLKLRQMQAAYDTHLPPKPPKDG